ncbi:MAG: oligosaccharide flippase family protein [Chloroflexota bacterium]|nr:oligosaccharide flippase family protein [Chloroflexota bacterium]
MKVIKNNIAYAIGSAANSLALFLLIPYLVNALPTEEYGAWALFEVAVVFLNMLILAGMDTGLMREYWFLDGEEERHRLSGTVLIGTLGWGLVIVGVSSLGLWVGAGYLQVVEILQFGSSTNLLALVVFIGFFEAIFALLLSLFRIREEAWRFVVLSVGRMFLFLVATIVGVSWLEGVEGALLGRLVAGIFGVAVAAFLARNLVALQFTPGRFKRVVRYGLPLLPTSIAAYVLFASDRYVMDYFYSLEVVAVYSFAYKVATTVDVLITRPFAIDWAPRRFKIATQDNPQHRYAQALLLYLFAGVGFALLVIAGTPLVYVLIDPPDSFYAGMHLIPLLLTAYLIYGLSYPLNIGIMLKDKTELLPLLSGSAAVICIVLNILWISRFGMVGAAWATIVAYAFHTAALAWFSQRFYPIKYSLRPFVVIIIAGTVAYGGIYGAGQLLGSDSILVSSLIQSAWTFLIWTGVAYLLWGEQLSSLLRPRVHTIVGSGQ